MNRLTWPQIQKNYPDQWVGLTDVEYEKDSPATIRSAVVTIWNKTKKELLMEQIKSNGAILARYTNPNKMFQLGAL
ncbi:MAG: hypothetical protein IJU50_06825 [Lachnospiraceae bacterium]|nr:hypothetical protein [Lachnospiraceae bacterium]